MNQKIIAEGFAFNGAKIIVREGLNVKDKPELRIELHKNMWERWDQEPRYEKRGPLYWGKNDVGVVRFFAYNGPSTGFSGSAFTLEMLDGTTEVLKGPWSSRSGVMNNAGFEPCVEVNIQGQYNMSSNMTIRAVNQMLKCIGYEMAPYDQWGETYYAPVPIPHKVALWPDGTWCELDELESMTHMSDDYMFVEPYLISDYEDVR